MQGKIIKGIAGFYYVHTGEGLVECRAKGIFRKEQRKPLVGDQVEISRIEGGWKASWQYHGDSSKTQPADPSGSG